MAGALKDFVYQRERRRGKSGSVRNDVELKRTLCCYHSHLELLQHIQESCCGVTLILEDGVTLLPNWRDIIEEQLLGVPEDWDMILAGWWNACREVDRCSSTCFQARGPTHQTIADQQLYFYAGQHGYLVRPGPHLGKVLASLRGQRIFHIDEMRCWGQGGLHTYALDQRFVVEDPVTSWSSTRIHDEMIVTLYVGHVPLAWSSDQLRALASRFGAVESATVRDPPQLHFHAKYGFLEVRSGAANAVIRGLQSAQAGPGKRFTCNRRKEQSIRLPRARPPVIIRAPERNAGSRGPLRGRMWRVGNAGRGRLKGSKNKKVLQRHMGRPTKVNVAVTAKQLVLALQTKLKKGAKCASLPPIKVGSRSLMKRFKCGTRTAEEIFRQASHALQGKGVLQRTVPGKGRQLEFFLPCSA